MLLYISSDVTSPTTSIRECLSNQMRRNTQFLNEVLLCSLLSHRATVISELESGPVSQGRKLDLLEH